MPARPFQVAPRAGDANSVLWLCLFRIPEAISQHTPLVYWGENEELCVNRTSNRPLSHVHKSTDFEKNPDLSSSGSYAYGLCLFIFRSNISSAFSVDLTMLLQSRAVLYPTSKLP